MNVFSTIATVTDQLHANRNVDAMQPPSVDDPRWSSTFPCESCLAWVKLEDDSIIKSIARKRSRNGDVSWAWFDEQGFVIGWVKQVVYWMPRSV